MTTERPASIIVANWREKICSDFGLTFFLAKIPLVTRDRRLQLLDPVREQTVAAQRVARDAKVGRLDLARLSTSPCALIALYVNDGIESYRSTVRARRGCRRIR